MGGGPRAALQLPRRASQPGRGPQPPLPFTHQPVPTGAFEPALALNLNVILNASDFTVRADTPTVGASSHAGLQGTHLTGVEVWVLGLHSCESSGKRGWRPRLCPHGAGAKGGGRERRGGGTEVLLVRGKAPP